MRWKRGHKSAHVEDRRSQSGRRGGRIPMPRGRGGRMGLGTLAIVFVLSLVFKQDFFQMLGLVQGMGAGVSTSQAPAPSGPVDADPVEAERADFTNFVLDDIQGMWDRTFPQAFQSQYPEANLVLYRDAYPSACGMGQAAMGPFYCPGDSKVYLDVSFFDQLHRRFGAAGDFAHAYVIAHEIGHHIQNVLGIEREVRRRQRQDPRQKNDLSIRMELQADCLAGVWARSTRERNLLEEGDLEEGLRAAAAVGDDNIQKSTAGYVNPDAFTHGTSEQRVRWFRQGLQTGDPNACDTFSASRL